MKTRTGMPLLAGVVLLAGVLSIPSRSTGQEGAGQGPIAFIELKKAIDAYEKTRTLEAKIDEVREKQLAGIQARKEKVNELSKLLQSMNPDSSIYLKTWREIEKEKALFQHEEACLQRELQLFLLKATREVYEEISAVCEKVRKDRGFAAVLKVDGEPIESESKAELVLKINSRGVVAFDPRFDVTADVIRELNAKLKKD